MTKENNNYTYSNIKLLYLFALSRLLNLFSKSPLNRFVFLASLNLILFKVFIGVSRFEMIFIVTISLALSISTKRLSDNLIMIKPTGHISMSLQYPNNYRIIGYKENKKEISSKLREEFVRGLIKSSKYNKMVKLNTHKWFINNVLNDCRITSLFTVELKKNAKKVILPEALSLFSIKEILSDKDYALKSSLIMRDSYSVVMIKR